MNRPWGVRQEDGLTWWPERQLGYYPVRTAGEVYDQAYFEKYRGYAQTEQGRQITAARLKLVQRWAPSASLVDVGIGCGSFIEARQPSAPTFGHDVNPAGIAWLMERQLYRDPERDEEGLEALTFWDSFEHLPDPAMVLGERATWAFMTLPIFTGPDHVLRSKHFRRDEHFWYFTRAGLLGFMASCGFRCVEHGTPEMLLGREEVETFAFRRQPPRTS